MADAADLLRRIRHRVNLFLADGDPSGLMPAGECVAEAAALVDATGGRDPRALHAVAMLHWCRYLALPDDAGDDDLEVAAGIFAVLEPVGVRLPEGFAELRDADPVLSRRAHRALASIDRLGLGVDPDGLNEAIVALGETAAALPGGHPGRGVLLCARFAALSAWHRLTDDPDVLDLAIESAREGVPLLPAGHPERAHHLGNLCVSLTVRHRASGRAEDIDEAVRWGTDALSAAGPGHRSRAHVRDALATALGSRFLLGGDPDDLDRAIELGRESAGQPEGGPEWFVTLHNLARLLRSRYELTGARADLDEAVRWSSAARDGLPADHPARGDVLAELTGLHWERSAGGTDREDLHRAIEAAEAALAEDPADDGNLSRLFTVRAARAVHDFDRADAVAVLELGRRAAATAPGEETVPMAAALARLIFGTTGEPEFLTDAIELGRQAAATPGAGPVALVTLSESYRERARATGSAADVDEAVRLGEQAVAGLPAGEPRRAYALAQLCAGYRERYELLGEIGDLHAAVETGRRAVGAAGPDDSDRPASHSNLAGALLARYERSGALVDLDEAIEQGRSSVAGQGDANTFNNLGSLFARRYERLGAIGDLNDAVDALQSAVDGTAGVADKRALRLNNLALALVTRYDRTHVPADLDRSVAAAEEAVTTTPPGDSRRGTFLDTLATGWWRRAARNGDRRLLDRAVDRAREAVAETAPGHVHRPAIVANLATYLGIRAEGGGSTAAADLDEAIAAITAELTGMPPDHLRRIALELTLGNSLGRRHTLDHSPETGREALRNWRAVAESTLAGPWMRLAAGQQWGAFAADTGDPGLAVAGYEYAVAQLPLLAWRGIRRADQEHQLGHWRGLAGDAAFAALRAGQAGRAVELLEHGRGVLWAQLLDSRTDLARVAAAAPVPAARLDDVRARLDSAAQ